MIIMKVNDSRNPSTVSFKNIDIGCAFFDAKTGKTGMYAVRIPNLDGCTNAVCLETGKLYFYDDDEEVTPIKAKIEVYA